MGEHRGQELESFQEESVQSEHLRVLEQMAAGIAHRFNNLLMAILGNAELARRPGVSAAETQDRLRAIAEAAREMTATVERVQQFAGESGRGARRPVDLRVVAEEALALTRPL